MEIINQHTKAIMEECKVRARDAGLQFTNESLEYIVTNRDMLELSPKVMIPTMYDYWVHDVEILKGKGIYSVYPNNPYETVINSRPPISYYNDNNPDWLNIMIFYHVLGHIDFFQNNILFEKTWNDDFVGQALADKRFINSLRSEYGRWVDYTIEFCRSINNLAGYFDGLKTEMPAEMKPSLALEFYFEIFLQEILKVPDHQLFNEIERYNALVKQHEHVAENIFFSEIKTKHPEFETKFKKYSEHKHPKPSDIMEFIAENSTFLNREGNRWMKSVLSIIRGTELYFEPQIRSKIINEGWASYWHDKLFREDARIKGHESAYAKINASVTSVSRVGLNPYAIGLRLIQHVEELADKGKIEYEFQLINDLVGREEYNKNTGRGKDAIFLLRKYFSDFTLINTFTSQEFVDKNDLFVVGKRLDRQRNVYQYYVKSRKADDYKNMLIDSLYHPPQITVNENITTERNLYLVHKFEGKQLYKEFIPDTLVGIEYLWGNQVQLETTEILRTKPTQSNPKVEFLHRRVLYTMKDKKLSKINL